MAVPVAVVAVSRGAEDVLVAEDSRLSVGELAWLVLGVPTVLLQSGAASLISTILRRSLSSSCESSSSGEAAVLVSSRESMGINGGGATVSTWLHSVGDDGVLEVRVDDWAVP